MNALLEKKLQRTKNRYRIFLGLHELRNRPIYNLIWIPVILIIIAFEYIKTIYVSNFNVPLIFTSAFSVAEKTLSFIIPVILIYSVIYLVGELVAREDESELEGFVNKHSKEGYAILVYKKSIKGNKANVREFYTNIPLHIWVENRKDVEHFLNCKIKEEDITYSKRGFIKFTSSKGIFSKESDLLYDDI